MAIPKKIINFLEKEKVKHEIIEHRKVFTAYDKSATLKVPEKISVKTLAVKISPPSKEVVLISIPANKNLDKDKLKKKINVQRKKEGKKLAKKIDFVTERWLKSNLKGVKPGAVPPFGNIWKLKSFIEKSLFKNPKIILNSGDNSFSIKMSPKSFEKAVPDLVVESISQPRKKKPFKKKKPSKRKKKK
jgi:Ala-tRNA(Pro) deacylase